MEMAQEVGTQVWCWKTRESEFPQTWIDEKIEHVVSDITTDPSIEWSTPYSRNGYITATKIVEGIEVKVVYDPKRLELFQVTLQIHRGIQSNEL